MKGCNGVKSQNDLSREDMVVTRVHSNTVESEGEAWACPICTYMNKIDTNVCDMCSYCFRPVVSTTQKRDTHFDPFKPLITSGKCTWKGKRQREDC